VRSQGSDLYPAGTSPRLPVVDGHRDTNQTACPGQLLYDRLPELDFSRDILQRSPELLRVMTVPACGWSDLGTPRRVVETVRRLRSTSDASAQMPAAAFLDLAAQAVHATA